MDKASSKYFNLYSNCVITTGYKQAVLVNLCENTYFFIPNELRKILIAFKTQSVDDVKKKYNYEFDGEIDNFLNYLINKNVGFYYSSIKNFIAFDTIWDIPYKISNIIISLPSKLQVNLMPLTNLKIDCLGIDIEEYSIVTIELIKEIIKIIACNTFHIFIHSQVTESSIKLLINTFSKLTHVYVFNTKKDLISQYAGTMIIFETTRCYVNQNNFIANIPLFTESQKRNTYFNRKLYIGVNGEIKNAPLTEPIFGNINQLNDTSEILDIIATREFQKYWFVHKDIIDVCKQCEFRHMCVDNRVPKQRNDKGWFMETECNYNPYIAKWKDEEGYKTLSECGVQSNSEGFKINRKKINAINKELWGD